MPKMVAFGGSAWLSLLATSATALRYPAVRGHYLPLVVRGARQPCHGTPGEADGGGQNVDGTAPDDWYADVAGWGVPPPWQRALDELIATLSYDGWQDDVADTKDVWNPVQEMSRMRHKQQVHDRRLTRPGWPVPLDEMEDEIEQL